MSITDGLQLPILPFVDVVGKTGTGASPQIVMAVPKLKVGVRIGLTTTLIFTGIPHCPGSGVNLYVPDAWLSITAGDQLPVTPLFDVVCNNGAVDPAQKDAILLKVGVNTGFDKINPVFNSVKHPLTSKEKPE